MIRECLEAHPATVQALIDFARKLIYGANVVSATLQVLETQQPIARAEIEEVATQLLDACPHELGGVECRILRHDSRSGIFWQ